MKIAIPWSTNKDYQYGDEYNISFNPITQQIDQLFTFLQNHQDTRFNISILNMINLNDIMLLHSANPHIYFKIEKDLDKCKKLKEKNIKFFFHAPAAADSFRILEENVDLGSTDVYIRDDLCYNLENVKKFARQHGVQVRMILDRIPSTKVNAGKDIKSPWFVPETFNELSKYIDIVEFDSDSWIKINTLYRIWFKNQEWNDNLRAINLDLEIDIPNQSLMPYFTVFKMNCGYRCSYGSSCNKCQQFKEIADDLFSKNIEFVYDKENNNET